MPRHLLMALLWAGPLAPATQSAPALAQAPVAASAASPASMSPAVLLRTAIVTSDLAASKRFYVEALGFRVRFDGDITRPAAIQQLGLRAGQTAWFVVLEGATSLHGRPVTGATVGLVHVAHPALPSLQRPSGAAIAAGEAMLAIETDRFVELEQRLRGLGTPFVVQPMMSPDGRETEMVVRDPSGTRVHIVERRP